MTLNIKHIWWDFSGTIFRIPKTLEKLKYEKRFELYAKIVGKPVDDKLKASYMELYGECGSHSTVFVKLGKPRGYWAEELQKVDLTSNFEQDQRIPEMFKKFAELPYHHSIFTNVNKAYLKKVLTYMTIDCDLFDHLLTCDNVAHPKPNIEGFEKIVKLSGVAPEKILFVGDRIKADILPAKKVGLKTALVWSSEKSTEADYTLPHVADVLSILQ